VPLDDQRAVAVGVTSPSGAVIFSSDGGASWQEELSLPGYATHVAARDGRVWVWFSTSTFDLQGGNDIASLSRRRTIIYRRDIEPAAPAGTPTPTSD
jgi:hypothetical protein